MMTIWDVILASLAREASRLKTRKESAVIPRVKQSQNIPLSWIFLRFLKSSSSNFFLHKLLFSLNFECDIFDNLAFQHFFHKSAFHGIFHKLLLCYSTVSIRINCLPEIEMLCSHNIRKKVLKKVKEKPKTDIFCHLHPHQLLSWNWNVMFYIRRVLI